MTTKIDAKHQPESDEILYRFFGDPSDTTRPLRVVSLCRHLRVELDRYLDEVITIGAMIKLTKAKAAAHGVEDFMPVDLSEGERFQFAEQATKLFFWGRGTRKCETCGHVARGKLARSTPEEKKRWKRELDETMEDERAEAAQRGTSP